MFKVSRFRRCDFIVLALFLGAPFCFASPLGRQWCAGLGGPRGGVSYRCSVRLEWGLVMVSAAVVSRGDAARGGVPA